MDINSIFEESGWGRYQYYIIANSSLSWMIVEFWFLGTAVIVDELNIAWGTSAFQAGLLAASQSVGCLFGGFFFGWLADVKGRMYSLKCTNVIYIIFTAVLTASVDIYMVIGCMFFIGAAYAGDCQNTSTLLSESLPISKRWVLTMFTVNWGIGGIIMAFLGIMLNLYEVSPEIIFRVVCAFIELSWIILFVMRLFMDESPKYLLSQGQEDRAQEILEKMARINNKPFVFHQKQELKCDESKKSLLSSQKPKQSALRILYTRPMLVTSLKLNGVFILQSGSVGLQTFMFLILAKAGNDPSQVMIFIVVLIQQAAIIPGVFLAAKSIDSCFGRKWTGALGLLICGICSFVYIADIPFIAVIIVSAISWFFLYYGYSGLYTITPESLYTSVRGLGQGIAIVMSRIGSIITSLIVGALLSGGSYVGAIIFIAALLVGSGLLIITLRETKGYDVDKNLRIEVE